MNKDQLLNSVRNLVYRLKTTECKGTIVNSEALSELRLLLDKPASSIAFPERKEYVFSSRDETSEEGVRQYNKALDDVKRLNGIE
jgi:hypothetical protein